MAQIKVYYEPEMELLTVFWQPPQKNQICEELGSGIILIKDENTNEPVGLELLSFKPKDAKFDSIGVEVGTFKKELEPTT
jgi:hypothetical protein